MKQPTQATVTDAVIQALGKMLYLNSKGVKVEGVSWEYYSILVMTGRRSELLELLGKIETKFKEVAAQEEKVIS